MEINKIKKAAEIAKARTNDRRWLAAIDKAVAGVESGWWIITDLGDRVCVTTECGNTYFANGICQCQAYKLGQACKHRALYRLMEIADEIKDAPASYEQRRRELVEKVTRSWPASWRPMAVELMARFKTNTPRYLPIDALEGILAAIAESKSKMKLQTEFAKSLPLTEAEQAINAERAGKGFEPYIKLCCAKCGDTSRLASREELAVERWTVYGKTARSIRCPKHLSR